MLGVAYVINIKISNQVKGFIIIRGNILEIKAFIVRSNNSRRIIFLFEFEVEIEITGFSVSICLHTRVQVPANKFKDKTETLISMLGIIVDNADNPFIKVNKQVFFDGIIVIAYICEIAFFSCLSLFEVVRGIVQRCC